MAVCVCAELGLLLILSPVINAWYVLWLLPCAALTRWRFALGVGGGVVAPTLVLIVLPVDGRPPVAIALLAAGGLLLAVGGELIERYQFFVASVAPRMPGGFRR